MKQEQTAMQIMLDELLSHGYKIPLHLVVKCKQLLEMEKQQIKKAWVDGNYNTDDDGNPSENYSISDEHYINTTYGGNK